MTVLTIFTTFVEKNYILFAVQKDEAGVVSIYIFLFYGKALCRKKQVYCIKIICELLQSKTEGTFSLLFIIYYNQTIIDF